MSGGAAIKSVKVAKIIQTPRTVCPETAYTVIRDIVYTFLTPNFTYHGVTFLRVVSAFEEQR